MTHCKNETAIADVLKLQAFHERFTLYLDAAGEPVQRPLTEMRSGEVLAAIKWHVSEGNRLEREAAPFTEMAQIVEAGGNLLVETSERIMDEAVAALRQAGEAQEKAHRLMVLVRANIPQWQRHPGLSLDAALHRFWPGGPAV
jgi:ribosomal protein S8